jgi:hypothetical protein
MPSDDGQTAMNLLREVNDRLREQAGRLGGDAPRRFVCECGDPDCVQTVMLTPAAFDARRNSNGPSRVVAHPAA